MKFEPLYVYPVVVLGFVVFSIVYYIFDLRKRLRFQEKMIDGMMSRNASLGNSATKNFAPPIIGGVQGNNVSSGVSSHDLSHTDEAIPKLHRLQKELDAEQKLFVRACQYMEANKPYTNPDMKVDDLVQALHTNRTTLGLAMKKCGPKGHTTQQFITFYRLRYAEQLLSDPCSELTVSQVVDAAGFKSRSAFNRQFTLYYQCTPSLYRMRSRNHADGVVDSKRENTLEK